MADVHIPAESGYQVQAIYCAPNGPYLFFPDYLQGCRSGTVDSIFLIRGGRSIHVRIENGRVTQIMDHSNVTLP